jgi:nucleotide-binding universal stress UspA family protein
MGVDRQRPVTKNIVIAVDATERTLDALALGKLLSDATQASVALLSVFPYHPLQDPTGEELSRVRDEARDILLELGEAAGVKAAEVQVVASNQVARELHRVTEQDTTGVMVLGSTSRGPVGRLLPGTMGERLLAGAAAPLAIATRAYAERPPARLDRIGVGFDGSEESRHAVAAGRLLARSSGARLRVISVFDRLTFGAVATERTGGAAVNELLRAELRRSLDEVLAEQPEELAVEGRFLVGSAREILAAESAELDLLVTGSRGYGPRAAILLGGTTHALMRTAACPGLVLPRGTRLDRLAAVSA